MPDPAEQAYIGVGPGRLLGVSFAGDSGGPLAREELFAGWRLFFERLAAEGPVALLVEDAQYADTGLLDFLDHLIDWARGLPIFVLVFARPELGQARPGFSAAGTGVTLTWTRWIGRRWTRLPSRWCPACQPGRGRRSPARRRASRCSPWKPSAR